MKALKPINIIIVDDNDDHLMLISHAVKKAYAREAREVTIFEHTDPDNALAELPPRNETVIIMDYRLTGTTSLDWLTDYIRADVGPVIVVTSSGDETIAAEAFKLGAADYIVKTRVIDNPDFLHAAINEALRRYRLDHSTRDLARRLKVANSELNRKNHKLAELTDTAHRFVDDVAHEFRTPLAVIKEFASIINDGLGGPVTEKQQTFLAHIENASRDLAHLVDDFLDSGRMRAQTLRIDRRPHSVPQLVESVWPIVESRAAAKHVALRTDFPAELPEVYVDADKVRRTLINLIVNAIKFSTAEETVTVAARPHEATHVIIDVIDRGPGLPADEVATLFERFRQGGEANWISTKGFGLGLNIVKQLAALNLGEVGVASELGHGCTFSFTLPRNETESIIQACVQRTAERVPDAMISALIVRRSNPGTPLDELRAFLASTCHASDVILSGPYPQSLLVIGETIQPDCWRTRLLEQHAAYQTHAPQTADDRLLIDQAGLWPVADAQAAVLQLLKPREEVVRYA
jgi:signal transduction histidine kinase